MRRIGYSAAKKKSRKAENLQRISPPSKNPTLTTNQLMQRGITMRATMRSLKIVIDFIRKFNICLSFQYLK
jgi:hypothetical protein